MHHAGFIHYNLHDARNHENKNSIIIVVTVMNFEWCYCCSYGRWWRIYLIISLAPQYSLMVFLSSCWLQSNLGQCWSSAFGKMCTVHSALTRFIYMPLFFTWAAKQSCPVLSVKFATASFLGLPLYSPHILWISLHFFIAARSSASYLYFGAILRFKNFSSVSVCNGVSIVCSVVPFLVSLSAILLPSSLTREETHWNMTIFLKAWRCLRASFMLFIFFHFGWLLEEAAWIAAFESIRMTTFSNVWSLYMSCCGTREIASISPCSLIYLYQQ